MDAVRTKPPVAWQNVLVIVGLGKAVIAGAGVGMAALGLVDVATAASVKATLAELTHNRAMDVFAYGGGAVGFAWKLISGVFR